MSVAPGSEINFILDGTFTPTAGKTFDFLGAAGGLSGFNDLTYSFSGLGSGLLSYQVRYLNNDGLQLDITDVAAPVRCHTPTDRSYPACSVLWGSGGGDNGSARERGQPIWLLADRARHRRRW